MIRCPNCTAQLEFDAASQNIKCDYCGSTFEPKELEVQAKKAKEREDVATYEGKSYECSQCGATLLTFDETAITFCSYCGSQAMIESKLIKKNSPEFIIPFKKTKEDCIKAYKNKLTKSFFTPNYMKSDIVVDKFRGIYIPYCIYKLSYHDTCYNNGEKCTGRHGDYLYYDDYAIAARVDADYDGVSFDMLSTFYDKFSTAIPHNYKEVEPFNTNYLAGFYADTADVNPSIYEDNATGIVNEDASINLRKRREFSKYGCNDPKINFQVTDKKNGMFPLYFLAIRDKKEKYVNYAIVNGQTGQVAIDLPVDFKKYILSSLILAIPIFLFINLALVIVPKTLCFISIIAAAITTIISAIQISEIHNRETHANDEGYMNSNKNNKKIKKTSTFKYLFKQILGIFLGTVVLLVNPVADSYYYGTSIIILLLVILSFYDLVKEHNLLVSTKLPQLEKRGGNENE